MESSDNLKCVGMQKWQRKAIRNYMYMKNYMNYICSLTVRDFDHPCVFLPCKIKKTHLLHPKGYSIWDPRGGVDWNQKIKMCGGGIALSLFLSLLQICHLCSIRIHLPLTHQYPSTCYEFFLKEVCLGLYLVHGIFIITLYILHRIKYLPVFSMVSQFVRVQWFGVVHSSDTQNLLCTEWVYLRTTEQQC